MFKVGDFQIVIWDFDGVIVFSEELREGAFRYALRNYEANFVEQLISYHNINGGLSRYHKFDFFFNDIVKLSSPKSELNAALNDYAQFTRENAFKYLIPNNEIITEIKTSSKVQYIASASDQKELQYFVHLLGISDHIVSSFGSPKNKVDNINEIISIEKCSLSDVVLIGDSINDYEAAQATGINFIPYNMPLEVLVKLKELK